MRRAKSLTRRQFLSLASAAVAGAGVTAGLSACARSGPEAQSEPHGPPPTPLPVATATPPPVSPPAPSGTVRLIGGRRDVWAWEALVSGYAEGPACERITVQVNGQPIPATLSGGQFHAVAPLKPGENQITAACAPAGILSDSVTFTAKLRNVPKSVIDIRMDNGRISLDGSQSTPAPVDPTPVVAYRWRGEAPLPSELGSEPALKLKPPSADGEYFIRLEVTDQAGRSDTSRTYFVVADRSPRLDDWSWQNTAWMENAVIYGVIPRKFGPHGFRSIQARLDALQELGVNAIWLAPINRSPEGDYGYAVIDYFELREQYGTKAEFRALVDDAHRHGIRVLMDFVPNHSSIHHPYFVDALAKGRESPYWTYYDRDASGQPTHYFNWDHLPNLNYSNPEVEKWMLEAFTYWVREFDVDGFRVDACWGIRQRKPDFWPRWRSALKRIKPDLLLLAEASARDDYYFTEGFDAGYDWTDQLGKWAWGRVFEDRKLLTYNLHTALTNNRKGYHPDALIFRFLNNNDTGARFLTTYGLDMTRVATVLLMTLPGIPCIYTGDEIGAEYTPYGDPQPLNWSQDPLGMYAFHQNLIHLRREVPALHARGWQFVEVEPHQKVYAYLRFTQAQDSLALVLLNFSDEPVDAALELPEPYAARLAQAPLRDLLSEESLSLSGGETIHLPPLSARILV